MMLSIAFVWLALALPPAGTSAQTPATQQTAPAPLAEELWAATRAGDVARVTAALDKGADVNAKTRYGATALSYAADRGNLELVKLLIARGANVNAQDTFYQMRAIDMAMMNNHPAVVTLLLERGSQGAPAVLAQAVQRGSVPIVAAALASSELTRSQVSNALAGAKKANNPEILALIEKKLAAMPAAPPPAGVTVDRATLQSYVGSYRNEDAGVAISFALNGDQLTFVPPAGTGAMTLSAISPTSFRVVEREGLVINFEGRGGMIERAVAVLNNTPQVWTRVAASPARGCGPAARSGSGAARGAASRQQARRADRGAQLARLPRRQCRGERRRTGSGGRMGRRDPAERPLEDRDPRHLERQPRGLGQSRVRGDRRQQRRRQDLQDRALRRRRAGQRSLRAHLEDLQPGQGDWQDPVGARRHSRERRRSSGTPRPARRTPRR